MKVRIYKVLFLLGAFVISLSSFLVYKSFHHQNDVGEYLYSNVISDMSNVKKVLVKVGFEKYNLSLEDDLWRIDNAGGYYASHFVLNNFLTDIYNSQIFSKVDEVEDKMFENPVKIIFFDKDNKVVEKVLVGNRYKNDIYSFVKKNKVVYVASGVFEFPKELISWIQQPAFAINQNNVLSIKVLRDGNLERTSLKNLPNMVREYLNFTYFDYVMKEGEFDRNQYPQSRIMEAETKDGLKVGYEFLSNENESWVKISLSTNKLPTAKVAEYVKENSFLYEGWFFKVPNDFVKYILEIK
ncbi:MAG: hypothetical protein ACK5N8_03295 [Alphaproteobacteria bacterium]